MVCLSIVKNFTSWLIVWGFPHLHKIDVDGQHSTTLHSQYCRNRSKSSFSTFKIALKFGNRNFKKVYIFFDLAIVLRDLNSDLFSLVVLDVNLQNSHSSQKLASTRLDSYRLAQMVEFISKDISNENLAHPTYHLNLHSLNK